MAMCALVDIFQSKVDKLIVDIKGIKIYINDILVLIKDCFENQIEQLWIIFGRLRATFLKVNAPKHSFRLKDIYYLGYDITSEDIKHDPKEVQGNMDLGRPATKI